MALQGWVLRVAVPSSGDPTIPTAGTTSIFYTTGMVDVTTENQATVVDGAQVFLNAVDAREAQGAIQKERPEDLIDLFPVTITIAPTETITLVV